MDDVDSRLPHKFPKMDTPLDYAQEEAIPLVEWALTLMGHYKPKAFARVIASTNHLESPCFVTGQPLASLLKWTKSSSDFPYEAERSMYTLRALTGQRRDSWLPVEGEGVESAMTWALNGVESTWVHNLSLVSGRPWSR